MMKRCLLTNLLLLTVILLSACASPTPTLPVQDPSQPPALILVAPDATQMFSRADMENLPASEAEFNGAAYKGTTLEALLHAAGIEAATIKSFTALTNDGKSVTFEAATLLDQKVIIAYARSNGDLTPEDGSFRLVLPQGDAAQNLAGLTQIEVIP